jgi:hypothetical protein
LALSSGEAGPIAGRAAKVRAMPSTSTSVTRVATTLLVVRVPSTWRRLPRASTRMVIGSPK